MKNVDFDVEEFKTLIEKCLIDGLEEVRAQLAEEDPKAWNPMLEYHRDYPSMSHRENGLPVFHLSNYGKRNYSTLLSNNKKHLELSSWRTYHRFFKASTDLRKYFKVYEFGWQKPGTSEESLDTYCSVFTYHFLLSFLDSYIHIKGIEFDKFAFEQMVTSYIDSILCEKVVFDIIVPILYANFKFEMYHISEAITIKKISEKVQIARNVKKSNTVSVKDMVLAAATHAFYLPGWELDNSDINAVDKMLYDINAYNAPVEIIDSLFASLRVLTDVDTGYGQIIAVPTNCKRHFTADLMDVSVISDRKYPDKFEYSSYYLEIRAYAIEDLSDFGTIFERLIKGQASFAMKKLNAASIRTNDEDSILDICSALESILTNDSKSEITYRLSIRASQLCKIHPFGNFTAKDIYLLCRKIYDHRSAIVHGDVKAMKKTKTISIQEIRDIEIVKTALNLLRHLLKIIFLTKIEDVKDIDNLIFDS